VHHLHVLVEGQTEEIGVYPRYRKTIDGPLVIAETGFHSIRQTCPHADGWLKNVEVRLQNAIP
jgi:hypothetical protein